MQRLITLTIYLVQDWIMHVSICDANDLFTYSISNNLLVCKVISPLVVTIALAC